MHFQIKPGVLTMDFYGIFGYNGETYTFLWMNENAPTAVYNLSPIKINPLKLFIHKKKLFSSKLNNSFNKSDAVAQ